MRKLRRTSSFAVAGDARAWKERIVGPLRPQEILTIPRNVASENEEMKLKVWRWFTAVHGEIVKRVPPFYLPDLPDFAKGCDPERIAEAKDFFGLPGANFPGTQEEMAKVVERSVDCARLRERQGPAVAAYLNRPVRRAAPARSPSP